MADIIQIRRGTAASATSNNPILADGEFGFETDTKKIKVGDGVTAWNSLAYLSVTADVATAITSASSKTTPVDADQFGITDSAASNVLKKLSWANIKATLLTYFNGLYVSLTGNGNLVQGTNVTLTGTLTNRLIGAGNVTINASGIGSIGRQVVNTATRIDDLALTDESTGLVVLTGTGNEITGVAAGGFNRKLVVINKTGDFVNFTHQSANSLPANRFNFSFGAGHDIAVEMIYDSTLQAWHKIGN